MPPRNIDGRCYRRPCGRCEPLHTAAHGRTNQAGTFAGVAEEAALFASARRRPGCLQRWDEVGWCLRGWLHPRLGGVDPRGVPRGLMCQHVLENPEAGTATGGVMHTRKIESIVSPNSQWAAMRRDHTPRRGHVWAVHLLEYRPCAVGTWRRPQAQPSRSLSTNSISDPYHARKLGRIFYRRPVPCTETR